MSISDSHLVVLQLHVSSQAKTTVVSRPLSNADTIYITQALDQKEIPCVFWRKQHPCVTGHAFPYSTGTSQSSGTRSHSGARQAAPQHL